MNTPNLITLLKGCIIGATMLVPGVSGGSMAMILGIYNKLLSAVSSFSKHKKENFVFLMFFCIGGVLGMLLFATPLLHLIEQYPMPVLYFFLGAVAGSIPFILRQAKIKKFSTNLFLFFVLGIIIVLLFRFLPVKNIDWNLLAGLWKSILLAGTGFLAAAALILPGISISYLFLVMGLYEETMAAISRLELSFLIPLGIGLLCGTILMTKFLEHALSKYPQPSYLMILGFMLGSLTEVFPGIPKGAVIILCIFTFLGGFFSIHTLSKIEEQKST